MRSLAAFLMWASFFIFAAAFIAGGEPKWFGHLLSAFNAAVFAALWAADR